MSSIERTLIIFKPDAVQRSLVGQIWSRFERAGLKVIGVKMCQPTQEHYHYHYETIGTMVSRRGQKTFAVTLDMMMQGPVITAVLEGVSAVSLVRKLVGATEPKAAALGSIRGDYAHMSFGYADEKDAGVPNLIHASGDVEEAGKEIVHWFSEDELFAKYDITASRFLF